MRFGVYSGISINSVVCMNEFTSGPVSTGMVDRLRPGKPANHYVTSHPGQLSLLPSVGRGMSIGQSAVVLCGWRVNAGMTHTCGSQVKLYDPSLIARSITERFVVSPTQKKRYINAPLTLLYKQCDMTCYTKL